MGHKNDRIGELNSFWLTIDQLAVAFYVTIPTEVLMIIEGEFHKNFVVVCPLYTLVNFACFLSPAFFLKKKCSGNTIRVSNSLDPDQARHFITSTCNITNPPRWNKVLSRDYQLYKWNTYRTYKTTNSKIEMQPFMKTANAQP